ncbi:MAG: hypothetical protein QM680_01555 [Luteolibacter sp.]
MAEGVNVRLAGDSAHPIENEKWGKLYHELKPGMEAADSEFMILDADSILAEARSLKAGNRS